jgi:DNA topoisomerase I
MRFKQFILESKPEVKEYSEAELAARQGKKTGAIKKLSTHIRSLKSQVASDLKSDDEKVKLTALAISLIIQTKERVGNFKSANGIRKDENGDWQEGGDKHIGVTGLRRKHIKFSDGKATLSYTGKSGVDHTKVIKDAKVVNALKDYSKKNKDFILTTEDGYTVQPTKVNEYLSKFDITAKDLRAFGGNELIIKALQGKQIPKEEKDRKVLFLDVAQKVADELGHSRTMLRNSYLLPALEDTYITKGKVVTFDKV